MFSEKLNFLMDITNTSNSALSHYAATDASYISRLRRGKRLMPRSGDCVRSMAAYFARHCAEDYQRKAISDMMGTSSLPGDAGALTDMLSRWLMQENGDGAKAADRFPGGFPGIGESAGAPAVAGAPGAGSACCGERMSIYYGVDGKRQAARRFLTEVLAEKSPQTLLLFSDEETAWMTDDPAFAQQWAALMTQALANGNRIQIIHTIQRDLDEMLHALSQWMPLYMAGTIEPYFCPKKRDGIFKRTLFIAPNTAAVVSTSVGGMTDRAANLLFRDKTAVASFAEEFAQYLRLCRPLMRIFPVRDKPACFSWLADFEKENADALMKTESLSVLTMPNAMFARLLRRAGTYDAALIMAHGSRAGRFHDNLAFNRFTEIIELAAPDELKTGGVRVAVSDMLETGDLYYTPDEYLMHLEHVAALLDASANFHTHLINRKAQDRYMVHVRDGRGVMVSKPSPNPLVLAISEAGMTASTWDYIKNLIGEKAYDSPDNRQSAERLRDYVRKFREAEFESTR